MLFSSVSAFESFSLESLRIMPQEYTSCHSFLAVVLGHNVSGPFRELLRIKTENKIICGGFQAKGQVFFYDGLSEA